MATRSHPYVGPRPFEREDQALFFGRQREASDLLSLVVAHGEVLVYAQSGAGKTSLLNARLIPLLAEEGFEVFPLTRVRGVVPEGLKPEEIANLYIFNTLLGWAEKALDPQELVQLTLARFLKERKADDEREAIPRVILFDQFEELFSFYPERWRDREGFFEQVREGLEADPLLRVVFVIREDYLAQLDPYAPLLPEELRTRFRLERMLKEAAFSAITGPLTGTGRGFGEGVAERLVDELLKVRVDTAAGRSEVVTGEYIEPVQLQVVCQSLWQGLPPEVAVVTEDHLQAFGDVTQALTGFYESAIKTAAQATGISEGDLREWFEHGLITPSETRGTVYRGPETTGGVPNAAVDVLENLHLIRGEWRAGARWYELTHDRLIEPIHESNRKWLGQRWEAEKARKQLEAKLAEWVRMGRGRGGLLDEVELLEAQRWLNIVDSAGLGYSRDVVALVEKSRAAIEEGAREKESARQRELAQAQALAAAETARAEEAKGAVRRARGFSAVLGVTLVLTFLAALYALQQKGLAEKQARESSSRELAAAAINNLEIDPERSMLLALSALDKSTIPEAEQVLHRAMQASRVELTLAGHTDTVVRVAYSPKGRILATASLDGTAKVWNSESGREVLTLTLGVRPRLGVETQDVSGDLARDLGMPKATGVLIKSLAAGGAAEKAGIKPGDVFVKIDGKEIGTDDDFTRVLAEHLPGSSAEIELIRERERITVKAVLEKWPIEVMGIAFNHNGMRLATAGWRLVKLWDIAGGREVFSLRDTDTLNGVAFSPDGKRLATAGENKTAKIWDADTGREVLALKHEAAVFNLAFSPDGTRLATAGADGKATLWDPSSGKKLLEFSAHTAIDGIAFSLDGKRLATASRDRKAKIWDTSSGKEILFLPHVAEVHDIAFSSMGALATASGDGKVRLWDHRAGQMTVTLAGHQGAVRGVAFSPGGLRLATAGKDKTARVWGLLPRGFPIDFLVGHGDELISAIAFSPDGNHLATASFDKTVKIWDAKSWEERITLSGHGEAIMGIAFSPDGRRLATASADETAKLWDTTSGGLIQTFSGHNNHVLAVSFSPDGKHLTTGSWDSTAKVWDVQSGRLLRTLSGHEGPVRDITFSPEGGYLATASGDGTANIWDAASGQRKLDLSGHRDTVWAVAFSPDGKRLATASQDGTAKLWDLALGKELVTLQGHTAALNDLAFSPDGTRLATASEDTTAKVWDAASGQELLTLSGHNSALQSLAFSPDGKRLATASLMVGVFAIEPEALIALARSHLTRTLTDEECRKYLHGEGCPPWVAALDWLIKGKKQAQAGQVDTAVASLRKAKALDPSLELDPTTEAGRLAAPALVAEGERLAMQGQVKEPIKAYSEAERLDPTLKIAAKSWNTLCWYGSLWQYAAEVMPACEKAVARAPESEKGSYRDSRGVARALVGNYPGAIEDFETYLKQKETELAQLKSLDVLSLVMQEYKPILEPQIEQGKSKLEQMLWQRQRWIDALRKGENPVTPDELDKLLDQ